MWAYQSALFSIKIVLNHSSITCIAYCLSSIIIIMLSVIINRRCFLLLIKKRSGEKKNVCLQATKSYVTTTC
jgi:hypothetical protein